MPQEPNPQQQAAQAAFQDALADLAFACAFATPDGGCDQVAALTALVSAHPHWQAAFDYAAVERFLAAGADASAALALIEPVAGYMLSRAPGGRHLVTAVLAGQAQEFHAEGSSAALALVGALATALAGTTAAVPAAGPRLKPAPEIRLN
ncbi:MAG: hypothetical protein ACKOQ3_06975 [Novosphingobium sp.]